MSIIVPLKLHLVDDLKHNIDEFKLLQVKIHELNSDEIYDEIDEKCLQEILIRNDFISQHNILCEIELIMKSQLLLNLRQPKFLPSPLHHENLLSVLIHLRFEIEILEK